MEKQRLDNKLYNDLSKGYSNLRAMMTDSINMAEKELTKDMDDKQKKRFFAFMKKHGELIQSGDIKTAKKLEKAYNGE